MFLLNIFRCGGRGFIYFISFFSLIFVENGYFGERLGIVVDDVK